MEPPASARKPASVTSAWLWKRSKNRSSLGIKARTSDHERLALHAMAKARMVRTGSDQVVHFRVQNRWLHARINVTRQDQIVCGR